MNIGTKLGFASLAWAMLAGCSGSGESEWAEAMAPIQNAAPAESASTANSPAIKPVNTPATSSNQANQARLATQGEGAVNAPAAVPDAGPAMARSHLVATAARPAAVATGQAKIENPPSHTTAVAAASGVTPMSAMRPQRFHQLATPVALLANKPTKTYSLHLGRIAISNFDQQARVNFAIKMVDSDWTDEFLTPAETREFQCTGWPLQDCYFWMRTGTKPAVYYTMHSQARYVIFWDDDKGLWDLKIAREGD